MFETVLSLFLTKLLPIVVYPVGATVWLTKTQPRMLHPIAFDWVEIAALFTKAAPAARRTASE